MIGRLVDDRTRRSRGMLLAGIVLAATLPIGIHTVMLDDLRIPSPPALPRNGWAALPDHALIALGVVCLDAAIGRGRGAVAWLGRTCLVFLGVAAINEALLRVPIMRNVVSTEWTPWPFVDNLPVALKYAAIAALGCGIGHLATTTTTRKLAAALLIALAVFKGIVPLLDAAFARLIVADGQREGDQRYVPPYDWHVDVPSYLTYVEPAVGAVAVALVLARAGVRGPSIAAIVFALKGGPLLRPLIGIFHGPLAPGMAMLSAGQFTLEAAALAIIAAATATLSTGPRPSWPGRGPDRRHAP